MKNKVTLTLEGSGLQLQGDRGRENREADAGSLVLSSQAQRALLWRSG